MADEVRDVAELLRNQGYSYGEEMNLGQRFKLAFKTMFAGLDLRDQVQSLQYQLSRQNESSHKLAIRVEKLQAKEREDQVALERLMAEKKALLEQIASNETQSYAAQQTLREEVNAFVGKVDQLTRERDRARERVRELALENTTFSESLRQERVNASLIIEEKEAMLEKCVREHNILDQRSIELEATIRQLRGVVFDTIRSLSKELEGEQS